MTRKRYVKLLMAAGEQRNEAETLATLVRLWGRTYDSDFQARKYLDGLKDSFQLLGEAIAKAAETMQKVKTTMPRL